MADNNDIVDLESERASIYTSSSLRNYENGVMHSKMTPVGATPEISGLYINSNSSLPPYVDRKNKNGSDIKEKFASKNGNEGTHYILIKSSGAGMDPCANADVSSGNPLHMTLEHAAFCSDGNCRKENCHTLKQFFMHYNLCSKNSSGGCTICFAQDAMVCQHSKVCKVRLDASCTVPNCDKVKVKILEEWMELKTRHANLMQLAFVILSHARICELDNCQMGKRCTRMKRILQHSSQCPKKAQCTTKQFLFSLCQSHKEICSDLECPVDFCHEKWSHCNDSNGAKQRRHDGYYDFMPTSAISMPENQDRKMMPLEEKRSKEKNDGNAFKLRETIDQIGHTSTIHDKSRVNSVTYGSNLHTYRAQDSSNMLPSQNDSRRPYSFGDPRQLPSSFNGAHEGKNFVNKQSPNHYAPDAHHGFDPVLLESYFHRIQCPIYCNTWLRDEVDDFCGGIRYLVGAETEFQKFQPPTDYGSLLVKESRFPYEEVEPADCSKNDYTLWPVNPANESIRFSPTKLQQILLRKDVAHGNNRKGRINESSSEKTNKDERGSAETKPAKRKLTNEEEKASASVFNLKKANAKAMHCARRLFPSTPDAGFSPQDSESDSEFCKNLSQGSSSQSESSEWTLKV